VSCCGCTCGELRALLLAAWHCSSVWLTTSCNWLTSLLCERLSPCAKGRGMLETSLECSCAMSRRPACSSSESENSMSGDWPCIWNFVRFELQLCILQLGKICHKHHWVTTVPLGEYTMPDRVCLRVARYDFMSTVSSWLASSLFVSQVDSEDEVRMLQCDDSGSFESSSPKLPLAATMPASCSPWGSPARRLRACQYNVVTGTRIELVEVSNEKYASWQAKS